MLLGLSLFMQILGVRYLLSKHYYQIPILESVEEDTSEFIIVSNPLFPAFMGAATDKSFLYVKNEADLPDILEQLGQHGITRIAILADPAAPLAIPSETASYRVQSLTGTHFVLEKR